MTGGSARRWMTPAPNRHWMKRRPSACCWKRKNSSVSELRSGRLQAPSANACCCAPAGLRYREIGEVLGIATSTVADIVERAVKKLAEKCNV